jgi:hypothetical protein
MSKKSLKMSAHCKQQRAEDLGLKVLSVLKNSNQKSEKNVFASKKKNKIVLQKTI